MNIAITFGKFLFSLSFSPLALRILWWALVLMMTKAGALPVYVIVVAAPINWTSGWDLLQRWLG